MAIASRAPKTIEEKILFFFTSGNIADGEVLFAKTYTTENKPPEPLIFAIHTELLKQKAWEQSYDFIKRAAGWFPENKELQEACREATAQRAQDIFSKGEKAIHEIRKRSEEFARSTAGGALGQERLRAENDKALREMAENTLKVFMQGLELQPDDMLGLVGVQHCLLMLQRNEEAALVTQRIHQVQTGKLASLIAGKGEEKPPEPPPAEEEKPAEEAPPAPTEIPQEPAPAPVEETPAIPEATEVPQPATQPLEVFQAMFTAGKLEKAQLGLEARLADEPRHIPTLLLMARCCFALKEYRAAEKHIRRALHESPDCREAHQLRDEVVQHKLNILRRAAAEFVRKGIKIGPYIGKEFFLKALDCIEQARALTPEDPLLLDQYYTTLMYLGQHESAQTILLRLRRLAPQYNTLWDQQNAQSLCFIAGWAYAHRPEAVEDFRRFRREVLLPSPIGRHLVRWYVRLSPHLVEGARRTGVPPALGRLLLEPVRRLISFLERA